jgi:ABC-type glycerol-3-phosphate transport system substrate-binding protein
MQPKSPSILILFSTFIIFGMAGCTPGTPTEGDAPKLFAGKTVRVACPDGPAASVVSTYKRTWENREGATVEVLRYDAAAAPQSVGAADAWVLAPAAMPQRAAADELLPLPQSIVGPDSSFGWTDLLPIYKDHLVLWKHTLRPEPLALPLLGESPLCLYRIDYFSEAARAAAFEKKYGRKIAPPVTWEDFADLAEHFRDTADANANKTKTKTSLPALAASDALLDREFFSIAACYARREMSPDEATRPDRNSQLFSFQYDFETGAPRIGTPGFVHALNIMKRLQACRPKGRVTNIADAFRDGSACLGIADMGVLTTLQKDTHLRDKIGIWRIPGGSRWFDYSSGKAVLTPAGNHVPYLGSKGWLAAVPKTSKEPDAAFSLLADLGGRERGNQIMVDPTWGGNPTRREHLERTRWEGFELEPGQLKALKESLRHTLQHPAMMNPAVRLRTITEAGHEAALLNELRKFLDSGAEDAAKVLSAVNTRWEELDRELEGRSAADDYRLSVGLLPKSTKQ